VDRAAELVGHGAPAPASERPSPATLVAALEELRDEMRRRHRASSEVFARVHPSHRGSAANLVDYLTLRRHDMRPLQEALAELGLSSLGRAEEHVITSLERVLRTLEVLAGRGQGRRTEAAVGYGEGRRTLDANALALLGPSPEGRPTRILVTMPSEAADDYDLVQLLVERGMDCARVNCAHDDPVRWAAMVDHLRRAAGEAGRPCPVLMDLPGPKLRTGPIQAGPRVVRLRPPRDLWGRPAAPARALLVAGDAVEQAPARPPVLPVPGPWLARLAPGDRVRLRDTRDSPRTLVVTRVSEAGVAVEAGDTTYVATGTVLDVGGHRAEVGLLPPRPQALVLRPGDLLTLTADLTPVPAAGANGLRIGCTLPEAFDALQIGHRVFFDDGKVGSVVEALRPGEADVRITLASPGGTRLRAEKGVNLPDSDLRLAALRPDDESVLDFVVGHADLVGLSFAQRPADVAALQRRLSELGREDVGMVLKVETARGFAALPEMLLTAMASERVGVMIARGDLAVECGFERLAELQEEMLWLCDAAHVPVIWATQVLDQMARTGQPSRAEISDAAMAGRAECVMLNKGPHVVEAVASLDDILGRMASHQRKKVALLRRLRSWSPEPAD